MAEEKSPPLEERDIIQVISPDYRSIINEPLTIRLKSRGINKITASCWHSPDEFYANPEGYKKEFAKAVPDSEGLCEVFFPADVFPSGPIAVTFDGYDGEGRLIDVCYLQIINKCGFNWRRGGTHTPPQAAGMKLVFADDFDTPLSVSKDGKNTRYMSHTPWDGDFGDAAFEDFEGEYNPFSTVDGTYMCISVKKHEGYDKSDKYGRPYCGGLISAVNAEGKGFTAVRGYFECRMLCPPGLGTWPAFWLMSRNGLIDPTAEFSSEIDVLESYGRELHIPHMVRHLWDRRPESKKKKNSGIHDSYKFDMTALGLGNTAQTFHTYGAKITDTEVIYYLDDIEVRRHETDEPAKGEMYFLVNLALGPGWKIELDRYGEQAALYVDYVRVYID